MTLPPPHTVHIHNYHLDGYGHVNNARYLEFLEEARWVFFRQHRLLPELRQMQLVVARMDIRYRQAAVLDDVLHIRCRISDAQSRLVQMQQEIVIAADGKTAIQAAVTLMPTRKGRVFRLPEPLLRVLTERIEA